MRILRIALVTFGLLVSAGRSVAQEGATIIWESYKDVEFDFGDSLLRVGSDYQAFAFATGAPSEWLATPPDAEPIEITSPITSEFHGISAAPHRATAGAVAGWLLNKDDASGFATLANAAAGTTAIDDKYDPTVVAMSWAAQTTAVDFGEEVSQGSIDWSPGILVGTGGGAFLSSYDTISIHDPIVVWTRGDDGVRQPTTLFELTAEFDEATEFHWNEIRRIQAGIDGPELVIVPNDGPFLNAERGGTGSFALRMDSSLLPVSQRGSLSVDFKDGIVTSSEATGVFSTLAPAEAGPVLVGQLPRVGTPARIDSLKVTNQLIDPENTRDRFVVGVDAGDAKVVTNFAACSDGVHVSVGPAVDTVQTFTLNPMHRLPVEPVAEATLAGDSTIPAIGACLGEVRDDADLLFGSNYSPTRNISLQPESDRNAIDRFMRIRPPVNHPRTVVFDKGENSAPESTRRWTATFDVRREILQPIPGPVNPVPVEPVPVDPAAVELLPVTGETVDADLVNADTPMDASSVTSFAIGLLDIAAYGPSDGESSDAQRIAADEVSLFSKVDGIVLTVTEKGDSTNAKLAINGRTIAEKDISLRPNAINAVNDPWQHFRLELLQLPKGVAVGLDLVNPDGGLLQKVIRRTVPELSLSKAGYRFAIGSDVKTANVAYDFDNLMTTFQQDGDLAWDGMVDVADFRRLRNAIDAEAKNPLFDIDQDGNFDSNDVEALEDLIPNKVPGDANLDGHVSFGDFLILSKYFAEETGLWSQGDFDGNGFVDFPDFLTLSRNYEPGPVVDNANVPEPSGNSCILGFLGVLIGAWKNRSIKQRVAPAI